MNTQNANTGQSPVTTQHSEQILIWAKDWRKGAWYCPHCTSTAFQRVDTGLETSRIIETFRCLRKLCQRSWKVEFSESAVCLVGQNDEPDGEWIAFRDLGTQEGAR